jgi:hypothetical protein
MGILMREQEETTTTAPPARTADRARVLNNMVTPLRSDSIYFMSNSVDRMLLMP